VPPAGRDERQVLPGRRDHTGENVARRGPQKIGNVLAELMARRGYGRVRSTEAYEQAWREAAGSLLAQYSRVGTLRRGCLEVTVTNSTLLQEVTFQKADLLERLKDLLPDEGIRDLRFRMGTLS
jgi:predicted nucleic acid-binding Zn ribbon protein